MGYGTNRTKTGLHKYVHVRCRESHSKVITNPVCSFFFFFLDRKLSKYYSVFNEIVKERGGRESIVIMHTVWLYPLCMLLQYMILTLNTSSSCHFPFGLMSYVFSLVSVGRHLGKYHRGVGLFVGSSQEA